MALVILIVQLSTCTAEEMTWLTSAAASAEQFDLMGAMNLLRTPVASGACDDVAGVVEYLEGLLAVPEAARRGGTTDSLRDLRSAVNALSRRAEGQRGTWEIASLVLRAAVAAAQNEREEMSVFLEEATRREALQLAANQPGVPLVTAHELAGDLWLQVHRYDDARRAYTRAAERVGRTGRVRVGLARVARILKETTSACAEYRSLVEWWGGRKGSPPEVLEARAFSQSLGCVASRR